MKRNLFAMALLATSLSLGLAGRGSAVVIWTSNVDIPIPTTFDGVYLDLDTGGGGGSVASGTSPFAGADANLFFGGFVVGNDADSGSAIPAWQPVRLAADDASTVANIPFGGLIGPASPRGDSFGGSFDHLGGEFTAGTPGYLGFSIDSGGETLYGWMLVTLNTNPEEGIIHSWAIQNNGDAIPAGVPEPTTTLLAILGLGGLAISRRRRR